MKGKDSLTKRFKTFINNCFSCKILILIINKDFFYCKGIIEINFLFKKEMKRKFMTRKPGNDKSESKGISTKFGKTKKLTKTKINTKIGTKFNAKSDENQIEVPAINGENFIVKFEINQNFSQEIFLFMLRMFRKN